MMASRVMEHCKPEDRANRKTSRPRNRKQQHDNRGRARSRSWDQLAQHYSRHPRSLSTRARASTYRPSGSTHHLRYPPKQKGHSIPSDITLPKNFENPLTCFFWHANGRCNKRDEDCNYAHWETGFLAVAPVNGGSSLMDDSISGQQMTKHPPNAPKPSSSDLDDREESLKIREQELNIKWEAIARKEKDLEKLIRLREKEFKIREKRIIRNEEALKKAEFAPWTCERCRRGDNWQGKGSGGPATSPLVDEGRTVPILPSYNLTLG